MRNLIALLFLVGGIAALVYGGSQLAGISDGSPVGFLIGGTFASLIGVAMVRALTSGTADAPIPAATSLGDHSLTDEPAASEPTIAPTATTPTQVRPASGRRLVTAGIAAALVMAGAVAAVIFAQAEPPNVPAHIDQACIDERRAVDGPAASFGMIVSYESLGSGQQAIGYETTQGWTWTCFYDWTDQTATVSDVVRS